MNQILDGAGRGQPAGPAEAGCPAPVTSPRHPDEEVIAAERDPVRRATLQQLRAAGVHLAPGQPTDG